MGLQIAYVFILGLNFYLRNCCICFDIFCAYFLLLSVAFPSFHYCQPYYYIVRYIFLYFVERYDKSFIFVSFINDSNWSSSILLYVAHALNDRYLSGYLFFFVCAVPLRCLLRCFICSLVTSGLATRVMLNLRLASKLVPRTSADAFRALLVDLQQPVQSWVTLLHCWSHYCIMLLLENIFQKLLKFQFNIVTQKKLHRVSSALLHCICPL